MIICPICKKEMNYINNSHLKSHNLTPLKFKEIYPNFNTISDNARKLMAGDKTNAVMAKKIKAVQRKKIEREDYKLLNKRCLNCGILIEFQDKHKKFCKRSCAATYTNKNRTVVYSEQGYKNLQEIGKKNSINFKKLINDNTVLTAEEKIFKYRNIKRSPFIEILCVVCKNLIKVKSYMVLKKTCSQKCNRINHSLNNFKQTKTYGKYGYYQGVYCASSWELAFLIYNKDLGKDIKRCELTFTYFIADQQHTYYPDFIMDNIIYEVKGYEKEDVTLKTEAVIAAGYKIEVIRKKEITPIIKAIQKKYNIKDIIKLYD